jgi:beta-glucosidase
VTPYDALKELFNERLSYSIGTVVQKGISELPPELLHNPNTGNPGVHVEFLDENRNVIYVEDRLSSRLTWLGSLAPIPTASYMRIHTIFRPSVSASQLFGYASPQPVEIKINGNHFLKDHAINDSSDPFLALMDPAVRSAALKLEADLPVDIAIEVSLLGRSGVGLLAQSFAFGFEADTSRADTDIAAAVEEAKKSDLAIVVVGTNAQVESEGFDRADLTLPGRQDELVEAVVAVNKNTIVIVNSGSPVIMPWKEKVRAILLTYFGGQEMGNAVVDILTGVSEPGGRLPTTWPDVLEDVPVLSCTPVQPGNFIEYKEKTDIGYRAWAKNNLNPAFEFGFGLGYTTWEILDVEVPVSASAREDVAISVKLKNTGFRSGRQVVQVYAKREDSLVSRPTKWLVAFSEVTAEPGQIVTVPILIKARGFEHWDLGWKSEQGLFALEIGTSATAISFDREILIEPKGA